MDAFIRKIKVPKWRKWKTAEEFDYFSEGVGISFAGDDRSKTYCGFFTTLGILAFGAYLFQYYLVNALDTTSPKIQFDIITEAQALTYNKVKVVTAGAAFEAVPELPLQIGSTITGPDLGNTSTTFTHKVQVPLGDHAPGTVLFVRVYVQDADHDTPTEIPDDGTGAPMSNYFTLRVVV